MFRTQLEIGNRQSDVKDPALMSIILLLIESPLRSSIESESICEFGLYYTWSEALDEELSPWLLGLISTWSSKQVPMEAAGMILIFERIMLYLRLEFSVAGVES